MSMGNINWFFPSWNGDHRLEPNPKNPEETLLVIQRPTADEASLLNVLGKTMLEGGWIKEWAPIKASRSIFKKKVVVRAPLEKVGPLFVWAFKPGPAVLTAVRYENGKIITCSDGLSDLVALSQKIADDVKAADAAPAGDPKKDAPKPAAAATVKRPTPCCPDCIPGSVEPAREVLLSFLTPEEHNTWSKERAIYVEGGLTGTLYRIAHRHTPIAQKQSRICKDLDSGTIVHFHDTTVPPEEEVLAAKLILEHREPWLRNEATMLGLGLGITGLTSHAPIFKNPFGGGMDGVADATFTHQIGKLLSMGSLQ